MKGSVVRNRLQAMLSLFSFRTSPTREKKRGKKIIQVKVLRFEKKYLLLQTASNKRAEQMEL